MRQRSLPLLSLALCGMLLLSGCESGAVPMQEEVWEMEAESVVTFPDGTAVDRWRGYLDGVRESAAYYELSDGTVLLIENDTIGPEADPGYAGLNEAAQAAVSAWQAEQGVRYDIAALLAQAYERWQAQGVDYRPGRAAQETALTAAGEGAVYFTTTVTQAADPAQAETLRFGAAFDPETGERLDFWALFTRPEAAVREALAAAAGVEELPQLAALIEPERVLFYPEHLEIELPAGAAEGQGGYTIALDYDVIDGLLAPWAEPGAAG